MVIKLQAVEPDTCATGEKPCRLIQRWDTDANPRIVETVGAERVCSAHVDSFPTGKMLWADGNWKDTAAYIAYQRNWFRWRNLQQWNERLSNGEQIGAPPVQIASFTEEPATAGSVAAPPAAEVAGLTRIHNWNMAHNARKNLTIDAVVAEYGQRLEDMGITWTWEGVGDSRILNVQLNGLLNIQSRQRVQAAADIQFGSGAVVIEP